MEEKKAPEHLLRATKLDISKAFETLAHTLDTVGLFCYYAGDYLSETLVMTFGSKSSPGLYEVVGDAPLHCLAAAERPTGPEAERLLGLTHPEVARFVDDFLSVIGMFGDRHLDHMGRLEAILQGLLGEEGVNRKKMGEEGEATNFKHAFGVVLDLCRRKMGAPWAKIVKTHALVIDFVEGRAPAPDAGTTASVRGLLQFVLQCAPGMGRTLLARLNMADGEIERVRLKRPRDWKSHQPSFAFKGESREQGEEMLRRSLSLFLRFAAIQKGKLYWSSLEAMLPPHIRTSCPGKESEKNFKKFVMDSSGVSLYAICLATMKQLKYEFSEGEQEVFNKFEEMGEHATTINHRELLTELFIAIKMGPEFPGDLLQMINDNTAAENWTRKSKHDHARVDQILSVIGVLETVFKFKLWGERVTSEDNFADGPTRKEKSAEHEAALAALEDKMGQKSSFVHLEAAVTDLGWDRAHDGEAEQDWYTYVVQVLKLIEGEHPGVAEKACGVPIGEIVAALEGAATSQPIPDVFVADGDYVEKMKSEVRLALTSAKVPTANQLQKRLDKLQRQLGKVKGTAAFNRSLGKGSGSDPQRSIEEALQAQFEWVWDLLAVENEDFDPGAKSSRPPAAQPEPLELGEGFRSQGPLDLISGYSGIESVGQSAIDTGWGRLAAFAERSPGLRDFLALRHPEAQGFESVEELALSKLRAILMSAGPTCTEHATANLYASGNQASFGGQEYERWGALIEKFQPAAAHAECTVGVLRSVKGKPSPLEMLKKNCPSYHITWVQLDAGKTKSPLTGAVAPLSHKRLHVFAWRKQDFIEPPEVDIPQLEGRPPTAEFAEDELQEGREYRAMAVDDMASLVFRDKARISDCGASYAHIHDPERGRGDKLYTNVVEDGKLGPMSTATSEAGSKWGPRELNGSAAVTMRTNQELARGYLVAHRQLKGSHLLDCRSRLGQGAIGAMIPMNVADAVACILIRECLRVQADGATAQEKWEASHKVLSARGKRKAVVASAEMEARVMKTRVEVMLGGKKPRTLKAYNAGFEHWKSVAEAKGWGQWLDDIELEERQQRILWWMAYEKSEHNIKASSIRAKKSAIRWHHVACLRTDPFEGCTSVDAWLSNLDKMDGPVNQKIPVVITLLKMIGCLLDPEDYDHKVVRAAMLTGFWLLLRSAEYLADDAGNFDPDRSATWGDLLGRDKDGNILSMMQLTHPMAEEMIEMTLRLYSGKNSLETCTRTVFASSDDSEEAKAHVAELKEKLRQQGSEFADRFAVGELEEMVSVCPVKAVRGVLKDFVQLHKRMPTPEEPLFAKKDGTVVTREEMSNWLKLGAECCGIPKASVASHSLRRGGASAYTAAGVSDNNVQRFGRWTSLAYQAYVYAHAQVMEKALASAAVAVPRFEMN
jgi:hypothetical protein